MVFSVSRLLKAFLEARACPVLSTPRNIKLIYAVKKNRAARAIVRENATARSTRVSMLCLCDIVKGMAFLEASARGRFV